MAMRSFRLTADHANRGDHRQTMLDHRLDERVTADRSGVGFEFLDDLSRPDLAIMSAGARQWLLRWPTVFGGRSRKFGELACWSTQGRSRLLAAGSWWPVSACSASGIEAGR